MANQLCRVTIRHATTWRKRKQNHVPAVERGHLINKGVQILAAELEFNFAHKQVPPASYTLPAQK